MDKKPSGAAVSGPRNDHRQGLAQYPDGQWGIDCRLHGRRVRRKVGTERQARDLLRSLQAKAKDGDLALPPTTLGPKSGMGTVDVSRKTIGNVLDTYAAHTTDPPNLIYCKRWRNSIGHLYPEQLTLQMLREWVRDELSAGVALATVYRKLSTLQAAWRDGEDLGDIARGKDLFANKKALGLGRLNNKKEFFLSEAQESKVQEHMGVWWPYALFALLTGIRWGNLSRMRWEDVQWDERFVWLPKVKARERLAVLLTDASLALLRTQQSKWEGRSDWCWPSPTGRQLHSPNFRKRVWLPAFIAAGLPAGTRWHDLRHTAASRLVQEGEDLYTVQAVFGWADQRSVQRYAHLGDNKLRAAMERLANRSIGQSTDGITHGAPETGGQKKSNP